jgi:hypothetical protein
MKRWSDLTGTQQRLIIALAAVEMALTATALIDLARRPAGQVRGSKQLWLLGCVVQPVGPLAYLALDQQGDQHHAQSTQQAWLGVGSAADSAPASGRDIVGPVGLETTRCLSSWCSSPRGRRRPRGPADPHVTVSLSSLRGRNRGQYRFPSCVGHVHAYQMINTRSAISPMLKK